MSVLFLINLSAYLNFKLYGFNSAGSDEIRKYQLMGTLKEHFVGGLITLLHKSL